MFCFFEFNLVVFTTFVSWVTLLIHLCVLVGWPLEHIDFFKSRAAQLAHECELGGPWNISIFQLLGCSTCTYNHICVSRAALGTYRFLTSPDHDLVVE